MSSSFALRSELRSIVLRGFQRLQFIEIIREAAESAELESRMRLAEFHADPTAGTAPTPLEIRQACESIQAGWSDEDREARMSRTRGTVLRTFTEDERREHRQARWREAARRMADRREAAGLSRQKPRRRREAVAC